MISVCSKVDDSFKNSMDRAERRQRRLDQKNWGGGVYAGKKRDASKGHDESVDQRATKCADCGSGEKKLTRRGPLGPRTLCSPCGVKWVSEATNMSHHSPSSAGRVPASEVSQKKARNAIRNLQDTSSEGESVEDIGQDRGADMYIKDLERKLRDLKSEHQNLQNALHVSDASVTTFRKLNDQRQHKIDELETLVESLTAKIKEISSPLSGSASGAEAECVRLRSEVRKLEDKLRTDVRNLEDRNRQLVENMELMSELLSKNFSAGKEILAQSLLINGDHNTRSRRSGVVTDQQQQTGHYQESKKASNVVKNKYDVPPGFEVDADVDVDADIGDNEPEYHVLRRERRRSPRKVLEDPVPCSNGSRGTGGDRDRRDLGWNRDQDWERLYHGESPDLVRERRREEVRGNKKDAEVRLEKAGGGKQYGSCSGEDKSLRPLVTYDALPLARQHVEQTFITWLNSKLRKPTEEEMEYHKTQFSTNGKTCYWSGIPGSELLAQYEEACPLKQAPDKEALELVLRTILHVEACPMRPNDVLWCLVWQDCMKIEHLPGYHDMDVARIKREMRRPRSPVVGVEESDRSLRQRFTYC
ncbi:hypothetical protein Mp_1g05310 [Marchantia polymorpha subsp. ruderalis]|uniref:GATA-type domain-containing protein n=2 Tax=Marchantia polymorpha TaxID=3197 RepID=A0AAF6ALR1_MARPO|nr:hypothetical protein MARPO_0005s0077 [Marchantia polymorpha]BBM97381.1 hypothetical protein Mp_1g05310 [Marchantia polymorpha subsp. ruderalis]|eukprot:PTQ48428.1 hypothetical protein MARPO_0005s0077 [Marchantia polymorpha]